jgi:hypothetical protein
MAQSCSFHQLLFARVRRPECRVVPLGFHFSNSGGDGCAKSPSCEKHRAESSVLSLASLLKNSLLALTRLFKCLKVFFERLADPLKQSPVFFPFLSRESAVRSVEIRQKFLLRKFHSFFRPPQVFQRFWGWHVALLDITSAPLTPPFLVEGSQPSLPSSESFLPRILFDVCRQPSVLFQRYQPRYNQYKPTVPEFRARGRPAEKSPLRYRSS